MALLLLDLDVEVRGLTLDTAIAAYLIDPAEARYSLPDLVEKYTRFARPSDDAAGAGQLDLDGTSLGDAELAARISFQLTPEDYRHWDLSIDGDVATLAMNVEPFGGLRGDAYELKLNSYDLRVDIELADAIQNERRQELAALERESPDVVVLDLMLPDMSGLDVLRRIRRDGADTGPRVIVLSAKKDEADRVLGFDDIEYGKLPRIVATVRRSPISSITARAFSRIAVAFVYSPLR